MSARDNPWTTLATRRLYDGRIVALDEHEVRDAAGATSPYSVVRYKVFGITVLPIDDEGCTYLIGQYRYPSSRYTFELPRGGGDLKEPAVESAKRELREETGLVAERWLEIGRFMPSPGVSDEFAPCFVAWSLRHVGSQPEGQEVLSLRRVPFGDAVAQALRGEIVDCASVASLLTLQLKAARGELPSELTNLVLAGS